MTSSTHRTGTSGKPRRTASRGAATDAIIQSPHGDMDVADMPLAAFVLQYAARSGGKPAIVDGATGSVLTYGELATAVEQAAAGLVRRGVAKGDVLALASPNCPEFAVAFYAAAAVGAAITTINPLAPVTEMARQLEHSGARWLVTTEVLFGQKGREAAAAARMVSGSAFTFGGASSFSGLTDAESLSQASPASARGRIDPDDLVYLPYSSGTMGLPKGVMLTHRNLVASLCQIREVHRVRSGDVLMGVLPWFHIFGLHMTLNLALREGATVVSMPRFSLEEFLRLIQEHRVTRADVVPPIVLALARQPAVDDYDLSSLRVLASGAAPLDADLAGTCARRIGCRIKQVYGMTELGAPSHVVPDSGGGDLDSIGPVLPGTECRLIDTMTGEEAPGARGELLVRGPGNMRGYLGDSEATAATIDPDGWIRTGDIATVDDQGWFKIVGRIKEIIKYKGHQVAPTTLEAILLAHPAVADAAVIGIPDEEAGEVPKAFVVRRRPVTAVELMAFVAAQVTPYERVHILEFVDQVPRSPSGKILRRILAGGGTPSGEVTTNRNLR